MSRIGMKPVLIPENVTVELSKDNHVTVKGSKGELSYTFNKEMIIKIND